MPAALPLIHRPRRSQSSDSLRARIASRIRAGALDARIRAGEPLDGDQALACRAHQLTTIRARHTIAEGLERAALRAALPAEAAITTRVPVQREAAGDAFRPLTALSRRLRDDAGPARAQGAALAYRLLTDGTAPLHAPSEPGTLRAAVLLAIEACDRRVDVPT
jgi:hypothetical protein